MQTITVYREDGEPKLKVGEMEEVPEGSIVISLPEREVRDLLYGTESFYKNKLNDILNNK